MGIWDDIRNVIGRLTQQRQQQSQRQGQSFGMQMGQQLAQQQRPQQQSQIWQRFNQQPQQKPQLPQPSFWDQFKKAGQFTAQHPIEAVKLANTATENIVNKHPIIKGVFDAAGSIVGGAKDTLGALTMFPEAGIRGELGSLAGYKALAQGKSFAEAEQAAQDKVAKGPWAFEKILNIGAAKKGASDYQGLTPAEMRHTVVSAAEAPLYAYGGSQELGALSSGAGVLSKTLGGALSQVPTGALFGIGQSIEEGSAKNLLKNMAYNVGGASLLGGAGGLIGGIGQKVAGAISGKALLNMAKSAQDYEKMGGRRYIPVEGQGNYNRGPQAETKLNFGVGDVKSPEDLAQKMGFNIKAQSPEVAPGGKFPETGQVRPPEDMLSPAIKPTINDNTRANPLGLKVTVPEAKMGDYGQVRVNATRVVQHVSQAFKQADIAVRRLNKSEKQVFWDTVENPNRPMSKNMKEAVTRTRNALDLEHAYSQALGGDTNYVTNYAIHNWDLSNKEDLDRFNKLIENQGGNAITAISKEFKGLYNQPRVFNTVAEGLAAKFKLMNPGNPEKDLAARANLSSYLLEKQSLLKGIEEADRGKPQPNVIDTGDSRYIIPVSNEGKKQFKAFEDKASSDNKAVRAYRAVNRTAKRTLLTGSMFHPINVGVLQAIPAMIMKGHGVRAGQAAVDMLVSAINPRFSDKLMQQSLMDGTTSGLARIGSDIRSSNDYDTEGKLSLFQKKLGTNIIFQRMLPAIHYRLGQAALAELRAQKIALDSPEARKVGDTINKIMGQINQKVQNVDPRTQRSLTDLMFSSQFTRAKWDIMGGALTKSGQSLAWNNAAIIGKYLAEFGVILAGSAIAQQKSDSVTDLLKRALISPSIPTNMKDSKGNTIEIGLPANYNSEVAGIVATLDRGKSGRLGVNMNPQNIIPNLEDYGRARLAVIPGMVEKLLTNTKFAGDPGSIYNPQAPLGKQVQQAATTLTLGEMPISTQGIAYNKSVNKYLPQDVQDVLNASSPGTNPIVKSIMSSFGATPKTDPTVGRGKSITSYYRGLADAKNSLDSNGQKALDALYPVKTDPVSGKYQTKPTVFDSSTFSDLILRNKDATPKGQTTVLDALVKMNTNLKDKGENTDPMWSLSKDQLVSYLEYRRMAPGGADQQDWRKKNTWYTNFEQQRSKFFNSLPAGDPNKPKLGIDYPTPPASVKSLMDTYLNLASADKSTWIEANPQSYKQIQDQFDKQDAYYNQIREAMGYAGLKNYPKASPDLQQFITNYLDSDKNTRKDIRNSNPQAYISMIGYFDATDIYDINKQGALSVLQGEPDTTSKQLKAIGSVSGDIYLNQGQYTLQPAGWMSGGTSAFGGSSSSGYSTKKASAKKAKAPKKPKKVSLGKISISKGKTFKGKTPKKTKFTMPKLTKSKQTHSSFKALGIKLRNLRT